MAKTSIQFLCRSCGSVQPKWMGKCPDCGEWDSLDEFKGGGGSTKDAQRGVAEVAGAAAPTATLIHEISEQDISRGRIATGIGEFDRVLGGRVDPGAAGDGEAASPGGLVPGSAVLLGGDPGIGKSTLMLQAAHQLAAEGQRVLYVTSEESAQQLRVRARRLGATGGSKNENLYVLADTNLARIVEQARRVAPEVMVIDSIQMIYKGDLPAGPGSVTQLRACCLELVYYAKATGTAMLLVGHVTKQGQVAGPRLLEHMVDTVLYFEGDRYHSHRVVRGIKNRFGTTLEVGLFEMTERGLAEVSGGAGVAAAEYHPQAGSVVCPVLQGSRCLLVEIQALTATGFLGSVKRKVSGLDSNRLAMLIAVLEKRAGLRLADQDVFASSVGGMRVAEPAADLAVAIAIAGAHHNHQLGQGVCGVGEVGLGGEVRHVQQLDQRLREAARLGFKHIICPKTDIKAPEGAELIPVRSVGEAIQQLG
ncbi:MAG: DNA repair protein RadA [Phycisphaeraceae bacterium]